MKPNFLIIGPPKCASSSLHFYLSQHPEVYMPELKEINFFTRDYEKGIDFYEQYFKEAGKAKAVGEATPAYSFLPFVADRIKKHYPDIKVILCFRNPADRAFSNWLMLRNSGVERAGFREAIEINMRQLKYISFEGEDGAAVWYNRPNNIERGEKWVRMYIQAGMYAEIMDIYLKRFSPQQIKYIFIQDLKNNFDEIMKELFTFIGVDNGFIIPEKKEKNYYYERKFYRVVNKIIGIKATRNIAKLMPEDFKNIFVQNKKKVKEIPVMNEEERKWLIEIYEEDILKLETITGRDCHTWINQ